MEKNLHRAVGITSQKKKRKRWLQGCNWVWCCL